MPRKYGIDPKTRELALGYWRIAMPRSRAMRIGLGGGLVAGGFLGFLPVLGFWMMPLGVLVLSHDVAAVRRLRRRFSVWWSKRRRPPK